MWSSDIACVPQKCQPYVVPHNCHRTWAPELPSNLVHRTNILLYFPKLLSHLGPRIVITWSPEPPPSCATQNWHPYVVPTSAIACVPQDLHPYVVTTTFIESGPQTCHPHVVPRTDVRMYPKNWSELSLSHKNYCLWRKSTFCYPVRRWNTRNCTSINKVFSISTIFLGKHNRLFKTCRKVNSSLYRSWSHKRLVEVEIH